MLNYNVFVNGAIKNVSKGDFLNVFSLGYDVLQDVLNTLDIDNDTALDLCTLIYNEFLHSEENKNTSYSEYEALSIYAENHYSSTRDFMNFEKKVNLMNKLCSISNRFIKYDFENMCLMIVNKQDQVITCYDTISDFFKSYMQYVTDFNFIKMLKEKINEEELYLLKKESGVHGLIESSINIQFYVDDDEIKNGLYINRPYKSTNVYDDDSFSETCDDCEMDVSDYCVATLTSGNIIYNIFTTHNLFNLYLDKVVLSEDGTSENVEMYNITGDEEEWETKIDILNYFMNYVK